MPGRAVPLDAGAMTETPLPPPVRIAADGISAEIGPLGAELRRVRDGQGRDLLWDGDPAFWSGRAPILFPVIGVVGEGAIRVDGASFPMPKHGFARHSRFALAAQADDSVTFRLEASDETRAAYPFDFRLDIRFACARAALEVTAELGNPGTRPLPASFGFHPALRWPLPFGGTRDEHRVTFERDEPAPIRRIDQAGLLRPAPEPTPVAGRILAPRDELFEDDALILDRHESARVRFGVPGRGGLSVSFPDTPVLGIWTKPRAPFLCIEPWHGISEPEGFAGDFRTKPGVIEVAPGQARRFAMRIAIEEGTDGNEAG